jgi:UDP-2,3-diacylglucosamine pyrophosphatase LpxH
MHVIVVSDLHLGSEHFLHDAFLHFLEILPEECSIVLNGDVIDSPRAELPASHKKIIDWLRQESFRREVVWILGNHDANYTMQDPGKIAFARHFNIGQRLLVTHGDTFDKIMPNNLWFISLFKAWHQVRLWLGAPPIHVACYAKKWRLLYRILTRHVMKHAIRYAKENRFEAITCGHTHYPEDTQMDGVRYINTGSWTETPGFYLSVNQEAMALKPASGRSSTELTGANERPGSPC